MSKLESKSIRFEIRYALSEKYRDEQFVETGKRPERRQVLELDTKDVPAVTRKTLQDKFDISVGHDNTAKIDLSIPLVKIRNSKTIGKAGDDRVRLSDYPVIHMPSANSAAGDLATFMKPLTADMLNDAIFAREETFARRRQEHIENLNEAVGRILDLFEEHSGVITEGEGKLEGPLVLKSRVLSNFETSDRYDELKKAQERAKNANEAYRAEKKRRKEKRKEKKRKRRERRETERREWAEEHGSEILQDALDEGYDCQRRYVIERVRADFDESYTVDFDSKASYAERSCPSEEALRFAQEEGGEVVWLTHPPKSDAQDRTIHSFDEREAVRKNVQIGEHGRRYDLFRLFEPARTLG
jgi:hypothetical protein